MGERKAIPANYMKAQERVKVQLQSFFNEDVNGRD
jgi:hypothetical protein